MKRRTRIKKVALNCDAFNGDGIKINIKILTYLPPHTPVKLPRQLWWKSMREFISWKCQMFQGEPQNRVTKPASPSSQKSCCERAQPKAIRILFQQPLLKPDPPLSVYIFTQLSPSWRKLIFTERSPDSISWLSIFSDSVGWRKSSGLCEGLVSAVSLWTSEISQWNTNGALIIAQQNSYKFYQIVNKNQSIWLWNLFWPFNFNFSSIIKV